MNDNITLETKSVAEITGFFHVPSYQRGYRWGNEVTRLLEDVYQNGEHNYCLQPIVVRKTGDHYELIDGQQRLTTLYLIYKFMAGTWKIFPEPSFSITYETRKEETAYFLENPDSEKQNDNIDFWFIAQAYQTIKKWFEEDIESRVIICNYFKKYVKVIWYEVGENEDAISLFTRLNIGKIPLTNAELVKAIFLNRNGSATTSQRQDEISLQWDNIEKELHNESLWYFLTNNTVEEYQTRIDLVLDLISGKKSDIREKYYTFFELERRRKENLERRRKESDLKNIWEEIYQTFLILKGWYEDHDLYHKIGYLITTGTTLLDIFTLSKGKKKDEFNRELDRAIAGTIPENYSELSYENPSDKKQLTRLLLLFNVESVRWIDGKAQRFPFDKFKHDKSNRVTWSLEHIHARQSEGMRTQEAWKEWLELHIPSVESIGGSVLRAEMEKRKNKKDLNRYEFEEIQEEVVKLLSGEDMEIHTIANLALLNVADNAALSNSTFDVKRNKIVEMDKEGKYIPFCTRMVFLKYYTSPEKNQLHFWGPADRDGYEKAIKEKLSNYIELKKETK